MKHLMTLLALVVAVTAGAQIIDTTTTGNAMHMNLNLGKLDSTIRSLQEIVEAQQATIESLETGSSFDGDYNSLSNLPNLFDGDYNSLSNQPTIPSNVSDLTNDAGYTTVSQADSIAVSVAWRLELSGADLSYANLVEFHLLDANLSGANLFGANLSGANLSGANLDYATLSGANLFGANLSGANLSGANLSYATLSGADLTGVSWTGAYILNCTGCTCVDSNNDDYCD